MSFPTTRARIVMGVCACLIATIGLLAVRSASARAAEAAPVSPDMFTLRGLGVTVNYSTTSIDGTARFSYTSGGRTLTFRGDEIRMADTALGFLVTVQLEAVPDLRTTTFTVVVPRINLDPEQPGQTVPVRTQGITTTEKSSIAPQLLRGQLQTYRVTPLTGTAQFVYF